MIQLLKDNQVQGQTRMKFYADKNRSEREFSVGDWVYLRLQPYRQTSIALRRNMKLSPKFFGPYQILEKARKVAYKLQLPSTAKIHPVFHVSLLKKQVGQQVQISTDLPRSGLRDNCWLNQQQCLTEEWCKETTVQWLVQWSNTTPEAATWEMLPLLLLSFPILVLEGKDNLMGEVLS